MSTLWNKLWCVILSLAILINLLSAGALAAEAPAEKAVVQLQEKDPFVEAIETATQQGVSEETQSVIDCEDITLRDEFTKHFKMSDGSYTATVYNEPIHQLVDGAWVEVDNTLTFSTSAKGIAQYQTVNGLTDVRFAQSFGNELVTMEQENHSITWGVEAVAGSLKTTVAVSAQLASEARVPVQAEILPLNLSDVLVEEQKVFATKATSTIQYSDALANDVDLQYTVLPSRIKESIILGSPQNISAYTVTVNTASLSARLLDNREVEFYTETGETVFTMWAPYMYDSASELSEDIEVELTALGNGQYAITLTPDAAWLNSPDRVYPIVIDPDVSASRAKTNIIDNTVMEGQGNQNRNLDRLYIGRKSGACVRAFLKYDVMPTIPSNATITDATQTLYITSGTTTGSTAGAYIVTDGDWSSDTITWANRPAARTTIQASISHNNFSYYRFSCLSAVQKWYTGSTIGKNANYGITVRYTNESINDYNAFYSADYSVESSRPLLTISYQIPTDTINIQEGTAYQLALSGVSGTVNWTSNNTSVATVNSSGQVTGIKAGVATITASVSGVVQKNYTVYVTISNGVYYIKSNTNLYLGTDGGIANSTYARIYSQATSGIAQLWQLWKVTYLANGYYTIRPLYKLDMVLCAPEANSSIWKNTESDDLASITNHNHRWTISYHPTGGGYALKNNGSNGLALKPVDPGGYPELNAKVTGYSASSASFNWTFEKVTSTDNQLVLLDTKTGTSAENVTRYVAVGDTVTLADMGIAAVSVFDYSTDQSITWSAIDPSVVYVDPSTGAVTGLTAGGTTTISATYGVSYSKSYTVRITEVPEGIYCIRSRKYNRYLQIDNNDSSNGYNTPGASVEQWEYVNSNYQKWRITAYNNGYYSIISEKSGLALSVPSGKIGSSEVSLVQEEFLGYDRQLWKITFVNNGNSYKIKAKSSENASTDLVMAVGYYVENDGNNVKIEQRQYVNDSNYQDQWFISPVIDIGMSTDDYFGGNRARSSYRYSTKFYDNLCSTEFKGPINKIHHYNNNSAYNASPNDFSINGAISNNIDFMIYIGHGHSAHDPTGNHVQYSHATDGTVDITNICDNEAYTQTQKDKFCVYANEVNFGSSTSDLRWVWMYTCNFLHTKEDNSDADSNSSNDNDYVTNAMLLEMMSGAHIVMGYASKSTLCDAMAEDFATYLRNGDSIYDAYFKAGHTGEGSVEDKNHYQKILYIPQARYETIYSPPIQYQYDASDVRIVKRNIHENY